MPAAPGLEPHPSQGLYDGQHEHDACGVAFVADMHGRRSNAIVRDALTALHNLDHRGASGAEPNTGDGAGILLQVPDEFLRAVERVRAAQGRRATPSASPSCPRTTTRPRQPSPRSRRSSTEEDLRVLGWRDVPVDPSDLGATALSRHAAVPPAVRRRHARRGRARRSSAAPSACASGSSARSALYFAVAVVPHARLQGHAHDRPAAGVLPRPARRARRVRDRAGALAVLDQHVPVVAARAPLPLHRAQRRDQHRQGQPQLDARPRGAAGERRHPGRPEAAVPDHHAGRRATRPASTRCSSCCTSAAVRCRTPC